MMDTVKQLVLIPLLFLGMSLFAKDDVSFTLRNNTPSSIPLVIVGVMNPNLSPFSNSGVTTEAGTEIYFFHEKKRYLLLTVSPEIADQTLDVAALIKARKKALGLK
ncbi:MAG: hypothetical protein SF053_08385 [Bacteroidia bacterium]|nr:hypothetical protein [Bacteroidia bacterium]